MLTIKFLITNLHFFNLNLPMDIKNKDENLQK
jgi:hypothetical protein